MTELADNWAVAPKMRDDSMIESLRRDVSVVVRYRAGDHYETVVGDVARIDDDRIVLVLWGSVVPRLVERRAIDGLGVALCPTFAERQRVCELQRRDGVVAREPRGKQRKRAGGSQFAFRRTA